MKNDVLEVFYVFCIQNNEYQFNRKFDEKDEFKVFSFLYERVIMASVFEISPIFL